MAISLRVGVNAFAVEPLSFELFGGRLELGRTVFRVDPRTGALRGAGSLALRELDISTFPIPSPQFKLTGKVRAEFPRLDIGLREIAVSGRGEADVFGGKVVLRDLTVADPFTPGRSISLNVDLLDLDLKKLTDEVPFGEVTGIIRGEIRGLVLSYGQPARFDLRIESVPRKGVPQTFSLKAVDNLTVLSSGQPASVGTGPFWMRFIRGFRYQKHGHRQHAPQRHLHPQRHDPRGGRRIPGEEARAFWYKCSEPHARQEDQLQGNDRPAQAGRPIREIIRRRMEEETMKKRYALGSLAAVGLTFILACITVNIYFPEATVKKTAEEIVDEIRQQEQKKKDEGSRTQAPSLPGRSSFTLVPAAFAQEATNVSTPAIRALKEAMKKRFAELKPYYGGGNIGETNNGLVDIRDEAGLNLQAKAALRKLVKDENGDRTKLYAEVAKALNIEASQIARVQKIFAESWIANAAPGWWVQQDDGKWVKKPAS